MNQYQLKLIIKRSLRKQGFSIRKDHIYPPQNLAKENVREMHALSVSHRVEEARRGLLKHEADLLTSFACAKDIHPEGISPKLVLVQSGSHEELLFRYASLHWSIPVSSGYGRRIRFLVIDEQNGKVMGLFGLGDPVFNLGVRDKWIGWDMGARAERLKNVMDAFVLGAVPPYSFLLIGKLVAMLVASNEVSSAFARKYEGTHSRITKKRLDSRLALITTTSALGRSSIYNRIKFGGTSLYHSVGFTQGFGEFHFSNGCYSAMARYAQRYCTQTDRHENWGEGFRNRREVVKKCLAKIGISSSWLIHGVRREVFAIPLAKNTQEFLQGNHSRLLWYDRPTADLFAHFRERWLLPRISRIDNFKDWSPNLWKLWPQ